MTDEKYRNITIPARFHRMLLDCIAAEMHDTGRPEKMKDLETLRRFVDTGKIEDLRKMLDDSFEAGRREAWGCAMKIDFEDPGPMDELRKRVVERFHDLGAQRCMDIVAFIRNETEDAEGMTIEMMRENLQRARDRRNEADKRARNVQHCAGVVARAMGCDLPDGAVVDAISGSLPGCEEAGEFKKRVLYEMPGEGPVIDARFTPCDHCEELAAALHSNVKWPTSSVDSDRRFVTAVCQECQQTSRGPDKDVAEATIEHMDDCPIKILHAHGDRLP